MRRIVTCSLVVTCLSTPALLAQGRRVELKRDVRKRWVEWIAQRFTATP